MANQSYHRTIITSLSPYAAMEKISRVDLWWKKDYSGSAAQLNDKFTVPFGIVNGHRSFVDFLVSEYIAGHKIVWKVVDCNLPMFKDDKEWLNTEIVFALSRDENKTRIDFTHLGLVPTTECYAICEKGWDGHVTKSLAGLLE
jgi:hypothetical protein